MRAGSKAMELRNGVGLGIVGLLVSMAVLADAPPEAQVMEEIIVTAPYPAHLLMEEIVVTAKYPDTTVQATATALVEALSREIADSASVTDKLAFKPDIRLSL